MEHLEKIELTNFTTPLQVVQTIPMFMYMSTLSNFLFTENFLNEADQNQSIPIVNALFNYVFDYKPIYSNFTAEERENITTKRMDLARKLIQGTGLYGAKENEILDEIFIDSLYEHIITTLVFENYTNIHGFLAEVVRNSVDMNIHVLMNEVFFKLADETFLTKNGENYNSVYVAIPAIMAYFINPLLPLFVNASLLATDYVYVQAGSIFLNSVTSQKILLPEGLDTLMNSINTFSFEKYSLTGHAIEQSVATGKINPSALSAFALPALLHYVYNHKQELKSQRIENIINNSTLVSEMLYMLLTNLNETYDKLEKAQHNDYRYQMYLALSNFKNRTALAEEMIKSRCPFIKEKDLEEEVKKYKEHPDNYKCNTGKKIETLVDINKLYDEQVNHITDIHMTYEKESIKEMFGPEFIKAIDAERVKISGIHFTEMLGDHGGSKDEVRQTDDLLEFDFVSNDTSDYYAILRKGLNMTLIRKNDKISGCSAPRTDSNTTETLRIIQCNEKAFCEKLNIESLESNYFAKIVKQPVTMKEVDQKFDSFLNRTAKDRADSFKKSLKSQGYDPTNWEWWRETLLSFIPFYSCYKMISEGDYEERLSACIVDVISLISFASEIESLAGKITSVTRNILREAGTSFGSLAVRATMRETLMQLGTTAIKGAGKFLLNKETFLNLGKGVLRFLDPGFELLYKIGKGGFKMLITSLESLKEFRISFPTLIESLSTTEEKLLNSMVELPNHIKEGKVYVNSLSSPKAGYGYPFIQVKDTIVHIREVENVEKVENGYVAAVYYRDTETKEFTWRQIDPNTEKICKSKYRLLGGMFN